MKNKISTSNHSEKRSHRKFLIVEQKEKVTILEDVISNVSYPYKKIYKPVGDTIILYIKDIDNHFHKLYFQYSVLNDYLEDIEYEFDVISKNESGFVIENIEDITLFMPLSFDKHIKKNRIKLTIEKIDIESNRLYFKNKESSIAYHNQNNIQTPGEIFKVGEVYPFVVIGIENISEEIKILKIKYDSFYTTVKAYDYQTESKLPSEVYCFVRQILGNNLYLFQDRYHTFKNLYTEGEYYDFTIVEKAFDKNSSTYYNLLDNYGFHHKLYSNDFVSEEISDNDFNTKKSFHLRKIHPQGYLTLYLKTDGYQGKFYTVEHVFEQVGVGHLVNELFYDLKDELKEDYYTTLPFANLFEDYDNKENLWFFSYLSFIHKYIFKFTHNEEYEKALELTEFYVKLEEWMLEGSHFLSLFSNDRKDSIILKAENQLNKASYQIEALKIIIDGKSDVYAQDILKKLKRSGYLRSESVSVFKSILFNSKSLINKRTKEILEIVILLFENNRLDDYDKEVFTSFLTKKNQTEIRELNNSILFKKNELDDIARNKILEIVKIQALLIVLTKYGEKKSYQTINTANFYHYLSLLSDNNNEKKVLLEKAISSITKNEILDISIEKIRNLEVKDFLSVKNNYSHNEAEVDTNFASNMKGAIYTHEDGLALLSNQQYFHVQGGDKIRLNVLANFFNSNIIIGSPYKDFKYPLSNLNSIKDYKENWNQFFSDVKRDSNIRVSKKKKPSIGTIVEIETKNFHKTNNNIVFVKIISDSYEGEGILHVREVLSVNIEGLHGIIHMRKRMMAKVIDDSPKGLSFSIIDIAWDLMTNTNRIGSIVDAQIVNINDYYNNAYLITNEGHYAQCSLDSFNNPVSEGETYRFRITDITNQYKFIILDFEGKTNVLVNARDSFRNFISEKLELKKVYKDSFEISKSKYRTQISVLISIIEEYSLLESNILTRVEFLYLLKFLSSIIKNPKSYYFDAQINYLTTVNSLKLLKHNETLTGIIPVEDETISIFNKLELINEKYSILKILNSEDYIHELTSNIEQTESEDIKKLSRLVLAHNILAHEKSDDAILLKYTKDLIYEHLSNEKMDLLQAIAPLGYIDDSEQLKEKVDIVVTNLGKEGKYREFKTSFIYFAGSSSIDIEKQSFVIIKTISGFLNANGGSLFIGVNDNGEVSGLLDDYGYFDNNGNSDKYERFIRKYIVSSFNKDINSQLEFKFLKSENNEYVEIVIPEYERPVSLNNEFFQRQGNETRVLKGDDLTLFFERKMRKTLSSIDSDEAPKKILHHEDIQTSIDFFEDQKVTAISNVDRELYPKNNSSIAYLYIFYNGSYMISEESYSNKNIKHSITINEDDKNGYLLQGYDNGCINKVDVRTLLDRKYGFNYSNGISLEGNLILLEVISDDLLVQINSIRNSQEYIKIIDTVNISTHNMLHLKGNNVVQTNNDGVIKMILVPNSFKVSLDRIIYSSKQNLGKKVNSSSYEDEFRILKTI